MLELIGSSPLALTLLLTVAVVWFFAALGHSVTPRPQRLQVTRLTARDTANLVVRGGRWLIEQSPRSSPYGRPRGPGPSSGPGSGHPRG